MIKEMVCIVCPMSCKLSVEMENNKVINVSGNTCVRGVKYATEELTNPTRMVTSTVFIKNAALTRLPVATSAPIPKNKINDVIIEYSLEKIKDTKIKDLTLEEKYVLSLIRLTFRELDLLLIDNIFDK